MKSRLYISVAIVQNSLRKKFINFNPSPTEYCKHFIFIFIEIKLHQEEAKWKFGMKLSLNFFVASMASFSF
jgi:hypothetical protein